MLATCSLSRRTRNYSPRRANSSRTCKVRLTLVDNLFIERDDYDIDYYVDRIQAVAARKLQNYLMLREKIAEFKNSLREEEEMHRLTVSGGGHFPLRVPALFK